MTAARPPEKKDTDPNYNPSATNQRQAKKPPFFATENPDDPICRAGMGIRQEQTNIFAQYALASPHESSEDHDREVAQITTLTGMSKGRVDYAITSYMCLRNLPKLRALQLAYYRLDIDRIGAIANGLADLGVNVTEEVYAKFDDMLVSLFSAKKMGQQLPTVTSITRRINAMIGDFDSTAAYDDKKRKDREEEPKKFDPGEGEISFTTPPSGSGDPGTGFMNVGGDSTKIAAMRAAINATAREHGVSQWEALDLLIFRKVQPTSATIYGYAPLVNGVPDQSKAVFLPGFGWTTAAGTERFHDMANCIIDLEEYKEHTVAGYVAPEKVKAYVRGRDGKCIFPGCTRSAWSCQLDHRIPYDDGGQTTASNLYCLCAHHHNMKTDRRAFYVPDPVTGEIIWLFDDGTYARTESEGFIGAQVTPTAPRWRASSEDIQRRRRKNAHFFAKGHTLIDAYEARRPAPTNADSETSTDTNTEPITYEECMTAITELEREFGMDFPFRPEPPQKTGDFSEACEPEEGKEDNPPF